MMGHLNSFSALGGRNLNKNFAKNTNARGLPGGGMLKLRFDWYITVLSLQGRGGGGEAAGGGGLQLLSFGIVIFWGTMLMIQVRSLGRTYSKWSQGF